MNCTDIAAIMDEHRDARLTTAKRRAIDIHGLTCADCAAAWHAHTELLALTVPAPAADLLNRVLSGVAAPPTRRSRRVIVVSAALLAGAALAAVGVTKFAEQSTVRAAATPTQAPATSTTTPKSTSPSEAVLPARDAAPGPTDGGNVNLSVIPLVRKAPVYPAKPLADGLGGDVVVQFDITAAGSVANLSVVSSSHRDFEGPAAAAVAQWKYLPRIVDGKRVATPNVQTVIRFAMTRDAPPPPAPPRSAKEAATAPQPDGPTFDGALGVALERVAADDYRGAELQLDEMRALYQLNGFQEGRVWDFYAYLYNVQSNHDRAIDAYEAGIAAYTRAGAPSQGSWLPLANLYYARNQYDLALRRLLTYQELRNGTPAAGRPDPAVDEFIARLRALGVTEATLSPSR